jgi:hypothetical protein
MTPAPMPARPRPDSSNVRLAIACDGRSRAGACRAGGDALPVRATARAARNRPGAERNVTHAAFRARL